MDKLETIKKRVKKLLALSKSPNENEAIAALEKAQMLMEEYHLTESDCVFEASRVKSTVREVRWRTVLSNAVAHLYSCHKYRDCNNGEYVFTGESLDAYMACEMYAYLAKAVERIAKNSIRKNAKKKFRDDFKYGMASRIFDRIWVMGKSCSWAPQRESKIKAVTEYVEKGISLVTPKREFKGANNNAAIKGALAADGISLTRQTTGRDGLYLAGN